MQTQLMQYLQHTHITKLLLMQKKRGGRRQGRKTRGMGKGREEEIKKGEERKDGKQGNEKGRKVKGRLLSERMHVYTDFITYDIVVISILHKEYVKNP